MTWQSWLAYLGQPLELLHSSNAPTAILHIMINAIRVLEPGAFLSILIHLFHVYYTNLLPTLNTYLFHSLDGTKRQSIKDMDGNLLHPKVWACSISGPFVLIVKEDNSIGRFMGEAKKYRRKDVSYGRQSSNSSWFSPVGWCWLFLFSFFFSQPRDTWQAASMQTCLGCWRSNTKVMLQPNLTCLQILKVWQAIENSH